MTLPSKKMTVSSSSLPTRKQLPWQASPEGPASVGLCQYTLLPGDWECQRELKCKRAWPRLNANSVIKINRSISTPVRGLLMFCWAWNPPDVADDHSLGRASTVRSSFSAWGGQVEKNQGPESILEWRLSQTRHELGPWHSRMPQKQNIQWPRALARPLDNPIHKWAPESSLLWKHSIPT